MTHLEKLLEQKEKLYADIIEAMSSNDLTLDEKWEILIAMPHCGYDHYSNASYKDVDCKVVATKPSFGIDKLTYLWTVGIASRDESVLVEDLLEILEEDEDLDFTEEDSIQFKQYCVDNLVSTFINDSEYC